MTQDTTAQRIDPAAFYSEADLTLRWGIGPESQRLARERGELKYLLRAGAPIYRGADLQEFFDEGGPSDQKAKIQDQFRRRPAKGAALSPPTTKGIPMYHPDPAGAFDEAVREKMSGGMQRLAACVAVAKENPGLHQLYLLANNPGARQQRLLTEKFDLASAEAK